MAKPLGVDSDLGKASGLAQGGKDPFPTEDCVEIHFSLDAIGEAQEETVAACRSDFSDVDEHNSV
jgi:hypothetical protein